MTVGWPFDLGDDEALRRTLARAAGWPDRTAQPATDAQQELADALVVWAYICDRIDQPWMAWGPVGTGWTKIEPGALIPFRRIAPSVVSRCGPAEADHYLAGTGRDGCDYERLERVGKKAAGRLLDGRTWDEMPAVAS